MADIILQNKIVNEDGNIDARIIDTSLQADPFATEGYVDEYGGKIDTIKLNGVVQPIVNKEVDLEVATEDEIYVGPTAPTGDEEFWLDTTAGSPGTGTVVTSINGEIGAVTIDADDIDDSDTTNKFVTSAEKTAIAGAVRYDTAMSLTDSEKAQARANIDAAPIWNASTPYPSGAWVIHKGELWHNTSGANSTGVEPGTNYNVWNVTYSNRNLLDNPWFAIDQRQGYIAPLGTMLYSDTACTQPIYMSGEISVAYIKGDYAETKWAGFYVKASDVVRGYVGQGYSVDRWYIELDGLTYTDNGDGTITLTNTTSSVTIPFGQMFEASRIENGIYTLTFEVVSKTGNNVYSITQDVGGEFKTYNQKTAVVGINVYTFNIENPEEDILRTILYIEANTSITIKKKYKLELGAVSTLANDAPPNEALELAKCKRYQRVYNFEQYAVVGTYSCSDNIYSVMIDYGKMRATPILESPVTINLLGSGAVTFNVVQNNGNGLMLVKGGSGFTPKSGIAYANESTKIIISANL